MATATADSRIAAGDAGRADTMSTRRIIAFLAMVFGMFMAILDIQIVSASLSEIQAGLSASSDEISWVQTAYLIAEVMMIPLSGFLSRLLSTRVLFTISAAGFTAASALCATATNIDQMIVYRAIQGFIGGGMIPSVFAAAFTIFPPSRRAIVSPMIGLVATLAPTIGPTVGGYISHAFSWHWLFLINVVPGILVATRRLDADRLRQAQPRADEEVRLVGPRRHGGLPRLARICARGRPEQRLAAGRERVPVLAIVLTVGAIVFFWRVFTAEEPIVDLRAFSNVNFAFGSVFSFVMGIGLYGLTYLYPVFLGRIRGYDSMMIGEALFVSGLAMFITAPITGILSRKMDPRLMMMIGFFGFAAGTWRMTHLTADWDFYELLIPQILRGCSLMLCMVPINNLALGTLAARPAEERVGPVQPHPQPRRRGRPRRHQHRAHRPQHLPLCAARRACAAGATPKPRRKLQNMTHNFQSHGMDGASAAISKRQRHGAAAGVADVLHGRVLPADGAVCFARRVRDADAQAAGRRRRRRRSLSQRQRFGSSSSRCRKLDVQLRAQASTAVGRLEGQRHAVDAVALAGRRRAVVEDVAEMTAAAAAMDFGAGHEQRIVDLEADRIGQRFPETRPAGAGIELGLATNRAAGRSRRS